jgi:3-oxoacyl-[acyl-carrier-protein] synthase II
MSHRVVITGLGPVTSAGVGREAFFDGVWNQRLAPKPLPAEFQRHYAFQSHWYLPLPHVSLADHGIVLMHEKAMHPEDRMVVLGAKLAFEDAGIDVVSRAGRMSLECVPPAVSTVLGTGLSSMQTMCDSYLCHRVSRETLAAVFPERHFTFNRMAVPKTMPNSPAAWASICFGLTGASSTVNAACASGTYAIGEAFRRIKDGYDQLVLTGGVESLQDDCGFAMRSFDVLGVLTQANDGWPEPFGRNRSGFLFAEGGACLLLLEELEHALRRGARIYAEVTDFCSNSEAWNILQIDPEGKQIAALLEQLSRGERIDYLNAHGTGTVPNDAVEASAIQRVFSDRDDQPLINSTKGLLGHTLGASGAIEAAVTALAIARGTIHGNHTSDPMDNLNLPLATTPGAIERAISVSYGFGGHNGGLRLERYSHG